MFVLIVERHGRASGIDIATTSYGLFRMDEAIRPFAAHIGFSICHIMMYTRA